MKVIKVGTFVRALVSGRMRHARVVSVTDQDTLSVSVGHAAPVAVSRVASTATRGTQFNA